MTYFLERIAIGGKKDSVKLKEMKRGKKEGFEERRGNGEML